MLLPFLIGTLLLVGAPGALTALLAFTHFDSLSPPTFAALSNFRELTIDPLFPIALANSLTFVALAVPLRVAIALGLALLLHPSGRGMGAYRAAVFLPSILPDVAYALAWLWIFNPVHGPLNAVLHALGLPAPAWLVEPASALPALVLMSLFQVGEGVVILLAARRSIPREYYESATTDGATRRQSFVHITLPLMAPWLLLLACRDAILTFQSTFVPALLMTEGGPHYATYFLPLAVYEEAFGNLRFGVASAMMWVMYLLTGLIVLVFFRFARQWVRADEN